MILFLDRMGYQQNIGFSSKFMVLTMLTLDEKICEAEVKTNYLVDHMLFLLKLHYNNRALYDAIGPFNKISNLKLKRSFNFMRKSLLSFEIIKLCAFWDKSSIDRHSIPTVIDLIRDEIVLNEIQIRTENHWNAEDYAYGKKKAVKQRQLLELAIKTADKLKTNELIELIFKFRNIKLAHNLNDDESLFLNNKKDRKQEIDYFFRKTLQIINILHLTINRSSFHWEDEVRKENDYAKALWSKISFEN